MTVNAHYTAEEEAPRQGSPVAAIALVPLLLVLLLGAAIFAGWVFNQRMGHLYYERIYPHVTAMDTDLSGMTRDEAARALLAAAIPTLSGNLVLYDGATRREIPWNDVNPRLDLDATVEQAFNAGRHETRLMDQISAWFKTYTIAPAFSLDLETLRARLDTLSLELSVLPVDATVGLQGDQAVIIPGQPGRVLDVTATLGQLVTVAVEPGDTVEVPLIFRNVQPVEPDTAGVQAQAEALLQRTIEVQAYDVLTDETLRWRLDRPIIATWLRLVSHEDDAVGVEASPEAVHATLEAMALALEDGRAFRYDEATRQILDAFVAGGGEVTLYLTHPDRLYTVESGDTLMRIGARFGMPSGLIAEANPDIDPDRLSVGQQITVPTQDILTPYLVTPGKRIVVSLAEQRVRVYENGALLWNWPTSTGIATSPTLAGTFQVISKQEDAYASQWDLHMPYFLGVYVAGGGVTNGFHELPINRNGQRMWEGSLGRPASFGCIILGIPQAQTLFEWAEIGTLVIIE